MMSPRSETTSTETVSVTVTPLATRSPPTLPWMEIDWGECKRIVPPAGVLISPPEIRIGESFSPSGAPDSVT